MNINVYYNFLTYRNQCFKTLHCTKSIERDNTNTFCLYLPGENMKTCHQSHNVLSVSKKKSYGNPNLKIENTPSFHEIPHMNKGLPNFNSLACFRAEI